MSSFNAQAMSLVVAVLIVVATAFAIVSHVEWSSEVAMAEFMTTSLASDHSSEASTAVAFHSRRTGCSVGKRQLPTKRLTTPL